MFTNLSKLIVISLLCFATHTLKGSEVAIWYSASNPDFKPFETGYGWAVTAEHDFADNWFVRFNHFDSDFRGSGPYVGQTEVEYWQEIGIGFELDSVLEGLYLYGSYTNVSAVGERLDGPGIHVGYQTRLSDRWSGYIQVGQLDTGFFDIQLEIQGQYQMTDQFSFVVGLRDHHHWDMTNYHVGVQWLF